MLQPGGISSPTADGISSPTVLKQYEKMRREFATESDKLTEHLNGIGKTIFENHARELIEHFGNENLEKLEPALKKQIESEIKEPADTERKRKAKIVGAVALLIVGGTAAAILAMQVLVVATAIVGVAGALFAYMLNISYGMLLAYPLYSAPYLAAFALTVSVKGAIIASISAVAAGIGLGVGIPKADDLVHEKERKNNDVDIKLTQKITQIKHDATEMVQSALKGEMNWEDKFNALIQEGMFTQENLKEFKEFLALPQLDKLKA